MQWWGRSPPTAVAWVRFQDPASYVGWVCCWFSSLLRGFFYNFSCFPPTTKTNTANSNSIRKWGPQVCQLWCEVSPSLNKVVDDDDDDDVMMMMMIIIITITIIITWQLHMSVLINSFHFNGHTTVAITSQCTYKNMTTISVFLATSSRDVSDSRNTCNDSL